MTCEEWNEKVRQNVEKIKAQQAAMNELMRNVMSAAGVENPTIADVDTAKKANNISIYTGDNGRRYIWYLDDDVREACWDIAARRYLSHEEIVRVFGLEEEEKKEKMGPEMVKAIGIVMNEYQAWDLTGEQRRTLSLAQTGDAGALCDLLASLGMENDARFGGFYEEIR